MGGNVKVGWRLDVQRLEQAHLLRPVELQPPLRRTAEQLAREPVQLPRDLRELLGEVGGLRHRAGVLLL